MEQYKKCIKNKRTNSDRIWNSIRKVYKIREHILVEYGTSKRKVNKIRELVEYETV